MARKSPAVLTTWAGNTFPNSHTTTVETLTMASVPNFRLDNPTTPLKVPRGIKFHLGLFYFPKNKKFSTSKNLGCVLNFIYGYKKLKNSLGA